MIIRNYGHLWERKYINWGRRNVRGHLRGYRAAKVADFREQIGIYVLFDRDLLPVYIGQAGNGTKKLFDRLKQHEVDHLWNRWEHFSWFGIRRVNKNGSLSGYDEIKKTFKATGTLLLNQVEGALITALEPKLNKQGARWKDVEEYYQEIDEDMKDLTLVDVLDGQDRLEKMVLDLSKQIGKRKH